MMERCPVCKARLSGATVCSRCQADLSYIVSNAQRAEFWMAQAQQFWMLREAEMSITALAKALRCKQTPAAKAFRDFICRQLYARVISLLAQQRLREAERLLERLDILNSQQPLHVQIKDFCRYLRSSQADVSEPF